MTQAHCRYYVCWKVMKIEFDVVSDLDRVVACGGGGALRRSLPTGMFPPAVVVKVASWVSCPAEFIHPTIALVLAPK